MLSLFAQTVLALGWVVQLLLETRLVHGATIPQSIDIVTADATRATPAYCNSYEGWLGDGIVQNDCAEAISQFFRTNVEPRGKQEFEFLSSWELRTTHLPYVVTPTKYDHGESKAFRVGLLIFLTETNTRHMCTCHRNARRLLSWDAAKRPETASHAV